MAEGTQHACLPGLSTAVSGRGQLAGPEVLFGGSGGRRDRELLPLCANTFPAVRAAPPGLDILQLLVKQIPTLRRVPIVASSSCSRTLTWGGGAFRGLGIT